MEHRSTGTASAVTAPLSTGGISTTGTVRFAAHELNRASGTTASLTPVEGGTSAVGRRPVLKAFGPIQQHGSSDSSTGCRFVSGLPTRRRLLGRRQQQQQQQQQAQSKSGIAGNTVQGCVTGSRSSEPSPGDSIHRRKRPTIKEFLGVNPADILVPLLSPPQKAADKQTTQNTTQGTNSSGGVSPLAFSVQDLPPQEFEQQKHSFRHKPSPLSSFLARLLPRGDDDATAAEETAANINDDLKEQQKRQQQDTKGKPAAAAHAPAVLAEEATRSPPGIITRPNATLVPAFNASEGDKPIWKPILYESKPIYLLPDGSVSNTASNTHATISTSPLWNGTQTVGTLPGCTVTTAASCVLSAANVPVAGSAPPTVDGGRGSMQVPPGLSFRVNPGGAEVAGGALQQSPTPLTASTLPGEDDPRDQNAVPLTNYQRYLKWKEDQRKQQLLYQQRRLQQQQHLTAQWLKIIESLIPQVPTRDHNGPSIYNATQKSVMHAAALGQHHQEQPFHLLQQQEQHPFNSLQHSFDLLEEQQLALQRQLISLQQRPLDLQQHPFDPYECQQHQTFDPHQQQAENQEGLSTGQEQQPQQQYGEQQQFQGSPLRNVPAIMQQEQETTPSEWANQPHSQSFQEQQRFVVDGQPTVESWQDLQQWGEQQNSVQQGEGSYGDDAASSLQHLYVKSETGENGYSPQPVSSHFSVGSGIGSPPAGQHVSPGIPWTAAGSGMCNSNAPNYVDEAVAGRAAPAAAPLAGQQLLQGQGVNPVFNFFPQPAYSSQLPPFADAMRPLPGAPFHPGFNYAEGISVHYNYYDAEEWTAKLQAAAATQREYSGSTQAGAEQEAPRDASEASLSVNSGAGEENAVDLGLKPLLISKQRLPSGQVFGH